MAEVVLLKRAVMSIHQDVQVKVVMVKVTKARVIKVAQKREEKIKAGKERIGETGNLGKIGMTLKGREKI